MTVLSNAYRITPDRSLDRQFLRTCAIYRLLKWRKIDRQKALELQNRPYRARESSTGRTSPPRDYLTGTIDIWLGDKGPLSDKGLASWEAWRNYGQD